MAGIEEEFRSKGVIHGGTLMFRPPEALELVRRCREKQVEVLGIDGFVVGEESTRPVMEESLDLSREEKTPGDPWQRAESFLKERMDTNLYFDVVTDEDD
jgi:hypothetical protein